MDYQVFLVRLPGHNRPTRNINRFLRVLDHGITISTLSPSNPSLVEYNFENVINIQISENDDSEFSFDVFETNGATSTHYFACSTRAKLLTALYNKIDDINGIGTDYTIKKYSNQREGYSDIVLRLRSTSLVKMVAAGVRHERQKASNMKKINLLDILRIETMGDEGSIVLLHMKSRVWRLLLSRDSLQFALAVQRNMKSYLSSDVSVERGPASALSDVTAARLSKLKSVPSFYHFQVMKSVYNVNELHPERTIIITNEHLSELSGDQLIGLHDLDDILGVVVSDKNDTEIIIEFKGWRPTQYFLSDRDIFVASLADVLSRIRSTHFFIRTEQFFPHTLPEKPLLLYQNECEIFFISRLMAAYIMHRDAGELGSVQAQSVWFPLLKDYACNIQIGDSLCIDSRPLYAVADILKTSLSMKPGIGSTYAVTCCVVLQRLLASRACFDSVKSNPDFVKLLLKAMRSTNSVVSYSSAMTVNAAVKYNVNTKLKSTDSDSHHNAITASNVNSSMSNTLSFLSIGGTSSSEASNKLVVLSSDNMQSLTAFLKTYALLHQNNLHVLGALEIFKQAFSLPPADYESEREWVTALENSFLMIMDVLCALTRSRSYIMFKRTTSLLMTALSRTPDAISTKIKNILCSRCVILIYLKQSIFSKNERMREISSSFIHVLYATHPSSSRLIDNILPPGFRVLYESRLNAARFSEGEEDEDSFFIMAIHHFMDLNADDEKEKKIFAWIESFNILRSSSFSTPLLVWNDAKRMELQKFLREEVENFDQALENAGGRSIDYNSEDIEFVFSAESDGNDQWKTIVRGVHLEILVDGNVEEDTEAAFLWKLDEPAQLFSSIFHSLLICFTPLYGSSGLHEIEPRLAIDALTWILERHYHVLKSILDDLKVIQSLVSMLREAIENEHQVFAFKTLIFLYLSMVAGSRQTVSSFLKAGGLQVIVPLLASSLARCCKDINLYECDASSVTEMDTVEKIPVVGVNGEVRMARVPNGKSSHAISVHDGSVEARDAINWQDDSVPEKLVIGVVLDILELILRLSGHERNVQMLPPSAACQNLTRPENLYHLVQILLRAKTPTFSRVLKIIDLISKANQDAYSRLYKYGIYEILLWKLIQGQIIEEEKTMIAKFLYNSHMNQDSESLVHSPLKKIITVDHIPWQNSILRLYLPPGIISKLIQEGAEAFKTILLSEEDNPEVIWNSEMRGHLVDRLTFDLDPYVKSRVSDPLAVYIYNPKPAVEYVGLADYVFLAPYYIQNLLDEDRFPNYHIAEPMSFHLATLREYQCILDSSSSWRDEASLIILLSRAQGLVLERFPKVILSEEVENIILEISSSALRLCIAQRDDCPIQMIEILASSAKILRCIATSRDKKVVVQSVISFALNTLSVGTKVKTDGSFPESSANTPLEPAIFNALGILEHVASTKDGRNALKDDVRWRKGFWWVLCSSVGDASSNSFTPPSDLIFTALHCLRHFSSDKELCFRVIKQGLLLPLLLLTIPIEDVLISRKNAFASESKIDPIIQSHLSLQLNAVQTLQTLTVTVEQSAESDPSPRLQLQHGALSKIIPLAMLNALKEPIYGAEKFLNMAVADLQQPTAIWNMEMRKEFREKVTERMVQINLALSEGSTLAGDELKWLENFSYDCLKDEIVIEGVFVKGYATGDWSNFDLPDGRAFIDALQDYVETHFRSLASVTDSLSHHLTPGNESLAQVPVSEKDFVTAMAALGECLRYAVVDGKRGMLGQVRYFLLADILWYGNRIPEAQLEVASIAQVLTSHPMPREALLLSELLPVMALQLWKEYSQPDLNSSGLVSRILEALLELSQEMLATIPVVNSFCNSTILFVLLSFFANVSLPKFWNGEVEGEVRNEPHPFRVWAARILGQLLLASIGVERRAKLVKDLSFHYSIRSMQSEGEKAEGENSDAENGDDSRNALEDVTDMHQICSLIEEGTEPSCHAMHIMFCLFPVRILSELARNPENACNLFDSEACTPELVMNVEARRQICHFLFSEGLRLREMAERGGKEALSSAWVPELQPSKPIFLQHVLATVPNQKRGEEGGNEMPLFSEKERDGYIFQLYLGGYFLDPLLHRPHYTFKRKSSVHQILREIRKEVVFATPSPKKDDEYVNPREHYSFAHRRRLLLSLLVLFSRHSSFLSSSHVDIFLPVFGYINEGGKEDRRGLTQPALLLFHHTINSRDMADFVASEELFALFGNLLRLRVPPSEEGKLSTDPRLCVLTLLLRLIRFTSKAILLSQKLHLVSRLADIVLETGIVGSVRTKAAEILSLMCQDRKQGRGISLALERLIPDNAKSYEAWKVPMDEVRDEAMDEETLMHFLQNEYPAEWWEADNEEDFVPDLLGSSGPTTVVEASVVFPQTKMENLTDELEGVFKHEVAAMAGVDTRQVTIMQKKGGKNLSIVFEVLFKRSRTSSSGSGTTPRLGDPEEQARKFMEKLEDSQSDFSRLGFERSMGVPVMSSVVLRSWGKGFEDVNLSPVNNLKGKDVFETFSGLNGSPAFSEASSRSSFQSMKSGMEDDEERVLMNQSRNSPLGIFSDVPLALPEEGYKNLELSPVKSSENLNIVGSNLSPVHVAEKPYLDKQD